MNEKTVLPVKNDYGYYEIRLESIGGLGANLCGKMLGELGAVYLLSLIHILMSSRTRRSPKCFLRFLISTMCSITAPLLPV